MTMNTDVALALLAESTLQIDQIKPLLQDHPCLAQPLEDAKLGVASAVNSLRHNGDALHEHLLAEYMYC